MRYEGYKLNRLYFVVLIIVLCLKYSRKEHLPYALILTLVTQSFKHASLCKYVYLTTVGSYEIEVRNAYKLLQCSS